MYLELQDSGSFFQLTLVLQDSLYSGLGSFVLQGIVKVVVLFYCFNDSDVLQRK